MKNWLIALGFLISCALFALAQTGPSPSAPGIATPSEWAIQHQPAAAAAATITRAAEPGMRHVARSVTVCVGPTAAQPSLIFNLRDGTSGAGTILWAVRVSGIVNYSNCVTQTMNVIGTVNTAMTLESAAAPAATNFATVALTGYTTQ